MPRLPLCQEAATQASRRVLGCIAQTPQAQWPSLNGALWVMPLASHRHRQLPFLSRVQRCQPRRLRASFQHLRAAEVHKCPMVDRLVTAWRQIPGFQARPVLPFFRPELLSSLTRVTSASALYRQQASLQLSPEAASALEVQTEERLLMAWARTRPLTNPQESLSSLQQARLLCATMAMGASV